MTDDQRVWEAIKELKEDLKERINPLDAKLERNSEMAAHDRANIFVLMQQVEVLTKLLTRGNGQPSVLARLESLQTSLTDISKTIDSLKEDHRQLKNHAGITEESVDLANAEAKKVQWATIGKIAGVVALATPGILSFLGF